MRHSENLPTVTIVGRANVGKSSLFNRLSRSRKAIVGNREGITVDRQDILVEDNNAGRPFRLVDTGGVGASLEEHALGAEIEKSANQAVNLADICFFVVDGSSELQAEDENVALWLRKRLPEDCKVWVIVNKCDRKDFDLSSYYSLGFDEYFQVSCEHNLGFDPLWNSMREVLPEAPEVTQEEAMESEENLGRKGSKESNVLVLGRPNMGKSTLVNALIREDKHAVSDVAGTTRDMISSRLSFSGLDWTIYDTAGLRQPGRRERQVEWVAGEKVRQMSKRAQVAIVLVDPNEGVTAQDASICGFALDAGMSLILVFNKWDLMKGDDIDDKLWKLDRTQDMKLEFIKQAPRLQLSAKTGKGVNKLLPTIKKMMLARSKRVQTSDLNRVFDSRIANREHPGVEGALRVKFYYISQISVNPPEFVMFTNVEANRIHFSFRRYVVNVLREEFGFEGAPVVVHFKKRG